MSNLPEQEKQEGLMYSESDMQHVVAREVMKLRQDDFEKGLMSLTNQVKDGNADVKASLRQITNNLDKQYTHVTECRDDMERDIEDKFFTKEAATAMEDRIESRINANHNELKADIKLNGSKLAWTMGGIGIAITIGQIVFSVMRYG